MKTQYEIYQSVQKSHPISFKLQRRILDLRHKSEIRVLAMGDSSVFGVGDTAVDGNPHGPGWTGRIKHDLNTRFYLNLGKNGSRVVDIENKQLPASEYFKPDLTLICVGMNDVMRGNFSPMQIRSSIVRTIDKLNSAGAVPVILGLPDTTQIAYAPKRFKRVLRERIRLLNDVLSDAALQRDAVFVSALNFKTLMHTSNWHVDRMHPSSLGHQAIATWVRELLGLPLRAKEHLNTYSGRTRKDEIKWLVFNGSKWLFKRSFDLFPMMLFLMAFGLRNLEQQKIKGWQLL